MPELFGVVADRDVRPILLRTWRRLQLGRRVRWGLALNAAAGSVVVRRSASGAAWPQDLPAGASGIVQAGPEGTSPRSLPGMGAETVAVALHGRLAGRARLGTTQGGDHRDDADLLALLIGRLMRERLGLLAAASRAARELTGAYAFAVVAAAAPDVLVVSRRGLPLAVGVGEQRQLAASDPALLMPWTRRLLFPEDGDVVELRSDDISVVDAAGETAIRPVRPQHLLPSARPIPAILPPPLPGGGLT